MRSVLIALILLSAYATEELDSDAQQKYPEAEAAEAGLGAPEPSRIPPHNLITTSVLRPSTHVTADRQRHMGKPPLASPAPAPAPTQSPTQSKVDRDAKKTNKATMASVAWDAHQVLWVLFESWAGYAFWVYLGLAGINFGGLCLAWRTQPFHSDGYKIRVRNLAHNLDQLTTRRLSSQVIIWPGFSKMIDAEAKISGYPDLSPQNLRHVSSVTPKKGGEAYIVYKPAIQIWHRAMIYHYLLTMVSFLTLVALNVLGHYCDHAKEVVLPMTRAMTTLGLLFSCGEHYCFGGNLGPQVSAFYRLLAWEVLSENWAVVQFPEEPWPSYAVCQDDRSTSTGQAPAHHDSRLRARRHQLAIATHAEALATMQAATASYVAAVCGLLTAILGALLGTVLDPTNTVASDIVTGMVFSIILAAGVEVLKGVFSWSRASNLYMKCAWIVDLTNGYLRPTEFETFLADVSLPYCPNLVKVAFINHKTFATVPELSVEFSFDAQQTPPEAAVAHVAPAAQNAMVPLQPPAQDAALPQEPAAENAEVHPEPAAEDAQAPPEPAAEDAQAPPEPAAEDAQAPLELAADDAVDVAAVAPA